MHNKNKCIVLYFVYILRFFVKKHKKQAINTYSINIKYLEKQVITIDIPMQKSDKGFIT